MTFRPGFNLLRSCGVLVAIALLTFLSPWLGLLAVPVLAGISYLTFRDFWTLRSELNVLQAKRILPLTVGRDVPFQDHLVLINGSDREIEFEVRDLLPAVAHPRIWGETGKLTGKGIADLSTEIRIPIRGEFIFGPIWLRIQGRHQFLEAQRQFEVEQSIRVYPELFSSREQLFKDEAAELQMLDKLSAARLRGAGTEFESMSEFRDGDDPRRIDWRTSARYRRPIVKKFQVERHRDLLICIDCGRLMGADAQSGTKLDCAVDASLLLSRVALQGGDRCGMTFYDDQVLGYLPPLSGPLAMRTIVDQVYALNSRWRESDFSRMFATLHRRHPSRALVVVLSDISDAETTQRFRHSLGRLAQRHVVLFAALQTPSLMNAIRAPAGELKDAYQIAVAHRLLKEREESLQKLRARGVHVLDVTPNQLTIPLINQYIQLRSRNLV